MNAQIRDLQDAGYVAPDTNALLGEVSSFLERFVSFRSAPQVVAVSLFTLHTYAVEAADATPYLIVTSAEKRSGKTRLLEVLEVIVRNPAMVSHISEAALYRTIAEERPTLLFDEVDAIFGKVAALNNEGLRGLLNAGYRSGATVRRCAGEKRTTVEKFDVFCPKVLAGIGTLPDTVSDRGVSIRMDRRTRSEKVDRFRRRLVGDEAEALRSKLEAWGAANMQRLTHATPDLPEALDDRAQDCWEPLLAIADLAGSTWPQEARDAALSLAEEEERTEQESLGILLLGHVKEALGKADRISTEDLLHALVDRDDGPWADWWGSAVETNHIKGPAAKLARILKPFEVKPKVYRELDETRRGYVREQLDPVFERYLPTPSENTQQVTTQEKSGIPVSSYVPPPEEQGRNGSRLEPPPDTKHETENPSPARDVACSDFSEGEGSEVPLPVLTATFGAAVVDNGDLATASAHVKDWNASLPPAPALEDIPAANSKPMRLKGEGRL